MSEQLTLPAEARDRAGKGASRALRREGRVPAVIYGDKKEPLSVHVEEKLLTKMLHTGHFMNSVVMIDVGGKPTPHAAQGRASSIRSPAGRSTSISCASASTAKVHVAVPVRFDNEEASPGLKRGGVLNVVQHELELVCDAAAHPERDPHPARRAGDRQFDPHQPGQAARGRQGRRSTTATSPSPPSSLRRR